MTIYNREDYRTVLPQLEKQFNTKCDELNKRCDDLTDECEAINDRLDSAVDFVVEQGTINGDSTYRKWNSGRAEFWYHVSNASGITTSVWTSPLYYQDVTSWSNVWKDVFSDTPRQVIVTSNNSQFISIYPYSWTSTGVSTMRFVSVGAKSSVAYAFSLYAVGKWK